MPRSSGNGNGARRDGVRKPTLSPTKISTFLDCAVKYRYIYIDKIGKYYLHATPGFSFGTTLHQVLQQYHGQGAIQTADEMVAGLQQKWISAGYRSAEEEAAQRAAAIDIVAAYHVAFQAKYGQLIETVATEKTISCDMGRFSLTGRVDRIDRYPDGSLEVVDYKSGRMEISEEQVAASLPMGCYQLIMTKLYPGVPIRGTIYCLRNGLSATYALAGEALDKFAEDITAIGSRILDSDWDLVRPVPIEICAECEFLSRCSTYWRQQERKRVPTDGDFSLDGL